MKNRTLLFTLLLSLVFVFANTQAQVITADRAKAIANSFFSAGKQKSAAARGFSSESLTESYDSNTLLGEDSGEAPTFHVVANPGGGFVVVSGEETGNPIIGYSFDSEFTTESELPTGLVDYLKDVDAQVRALREYNAAQPQKSAASRSAMQRDAYNATSMGNIVKELNTAPWNQGAPFNNLCLISGGKQALTGCVPTAYAILCHYYKWPVAATGKGVNAVTGEKVTFGHEYDYENMLYDYSKGYNDIQAAAVATLMRDLGYAYQVTYGTGDTPSEIKGEGASVLISQFGFKSLSTTHTGTTYATSRGDDATWKALIKNSLDQDHPIPYSAYNPNSGGRHIFVLDGYTDNGYYHFNFGWGGDGNGWFTLDNVAPTNYNQYTQSHKAYFELVPDRQVCTVAASVSPGGVGTVSINGGEAGATVESEVFVGAGVTLSAVVNDGYVFSHWSKDGAVVSDANPYTFVVAGNVNYTAEFEKEEEPVTPPVVSGVSLGYEVSPLSGAEMTDPSASWAYKSGYQGAEYTAPLTMKALTPQGVGVKNIDILDDGKLSLMACTAISNNKQNSTTFTIEVPNESGYKITGYSIDCKAYRDLIVTHGGMQVSMADGTSERLAAEGLDECSVDVVVAVERYNQSAALDITSFVVYVQYVSGTTAVEEIEGENENVKIVYDLSGRRVNEMTKPGIYIVDGRKVVVR